MANNFHFEDDRPADYEALFDLAQLTASQYGPMEGGMAAVYVFRNPYEGGWQAKADWSNNEETLTEVHERVCDALWELINNLRRTDERSRRSENRKKREAT